MKVYVTPHAKLRFRQRFVDIDGPILEKVIRKLLAHSVDCNYGRSRANVKVWLHRETGVMLVVNLDRADVIKVVTVMKART